MFITNVLDTWKQKKNPRVSSVVGERDLMTGEGLFKSGWF